MEHKVKVVMLPTEDISQIWKNVKHNSLWLVDDYIIREAKRNNQTKDYQHLYITVSQDVEPIKEGDWCTYVDFTNDIRIEQIKHLDKSSILIHEYRKIIATTDLKLIQYVGENYVGTIQRIEGKNYKIIPQLPQSFLKEYVDNPDGEYEVEYEKDRFIHIAGAFGGKIKVGLKLNQDNTVNITSVEEKMYSREEVISLCRTAANDYVEIITDEDNWINKNL
jgi:hypothetical protein